MTFAAAAQAMLTTLPAKGAQFWLARAAGGLLFGGAIAILESAHYFSIEAGFLSFLSLLMVYGGECVLLALVVGLAEYWVRPRELRAWELALAVAVGVVVGVLIWRAFGQFVLRDRLGIPLFMYHYLRQPVTWGVQALYHGWLLLFFGGLIAAVYAAQRSRERMLAALRAAELGRASLQRRLAQASLASLQARIDPEHLSQELAKLERLYETDPTAADRLLDELVAFLRNALGHTRTADALPRKLEEPA